MTKRSLLLHRAAIAVLLVTLICTGSAYRNADNARREAEQRERLHQYDATRWRTGVESIAIQLDMVRAENAELQIEVRSVHAAYDKANDERNEQARLIAHLRKVKGADAVRPLYIKED